MAKLKTMVQVNKEFQNSINIQLDLNQEEKIMNYIPTRSSLTILERYLDNVQQKSQEKATLLIGPYGKGKSHLVLLLLGILSMEKESDACIDAVAKKIGNINKNCENKIKEIRSNEKRFLPVIISNAKDDLHQAFLVALNAALQAAKITEIAPETSYQVAIETIDNWKENYQATYQQFELILQEKKLTVAKFKKRLEKCDNKIYQLFQKIYPKLTAGSKFNPLIHMDIISIYESVNNSLCKDFGYSGIIIIFDEFSKYIEGHATETISADMKIVQDMCELANASRQNQMHIIFIAHKSLKEYGKLLSKSVVNSFKGVEGRLTEVRFLTSAKNNYELIENAIGKLKAVPVEKKIVEDNYKLSVFNTLFEQDEFEKIIVKGCYPLQPLSAYFLLNISEKVAQNERTLFTFISKDEPYSLARLIHKGQEDPIGLDQIYDYFNPIFREDMNHVFIHSEWLKAEYAISNIDNIMEKRIVKAIAMIRMLNRTEEIRVCEEVLELGLGLKNGEVQKTLDALIHKKIIVFRKRSNAFEFKNNVGVDVEKEIKKIVQTKFAKFNLCEQVEQLLEIDYEFPKSYNSKNHMTRYFACKYMLMKDFLALTNTQYLFEEQFSDGKILYLIYDHDVSRVEVLEQLQKLQDERIVVVYPKEECLFAKMLKELAAIRQLKNDKEFIEGNKVLGKELDILEDDVKYEITTEIERIYDSSNGNCYIITRNGIEENLSRIQFNRMLGDLLYERYNKTPRINQELINRNHISAQVKKARGEIVQRLLDQDGFDDLKASGSSEATIFRATLIHTGILSKKDTDENIQYILNIIKKFIDESEEKKCFEGLYQRLLDHNIGMRKGVIPIYLAYGLSQVKQAVVYLKNKEFEIDKNVISNINESPEDYYLLVEKGTKEKEDYLNAIEMLYENFSMSHIEKKNRFGNILESINLWYRSLPQYTRNSEAYEHCDQRELRKFRKLLKNRELNPRELIMDQLPKVFNCSDDYKATFGKLKRMKEAMDRFLSGKKFNVMTETRRIFEMDLQGDLNRSFKEWYIRQSASSKNMLYSSKITSFMNYIKEIETHNEEDIINRISKIVIDLYIEDWNDQSFDYFIEEVTRIKQDIEDISDDDKVEEGQDFISFKTKEGKVVERNYVRDDEESNGIFLKNAMDDVLEEFGDSLEINQKISVLTQLLEELLEN